MPRNSVTTPPRRRPTRLLVKPEGLVSLPGQDSGTTWLTSSSCRDDAFIRVSLDVASYKLLNLTSTVANAFHDFVSNIQFLLLSNSQPFPPTQQPTATTSPRHRKANSAPRQHEPALSQGDVIRKIQSSLASKWNRHAAEISKYWRSFGPKKRVECINTVATDEAGAMQSIVLQQPLDSRWEASTR